MDTSQHRPRTFSLFSLFSSSSLFSPSSSLALILVLAGIVSIAAPARALTIDFEGLGDPEVVTNQYASDGITFANALALTAFSTLNEIDFPPSSGLKAITGLGNGPLAFSFAGAVQVVSLQVTTFDIASVSFYDAADVLLSQILVDPNLGMNTLVSFAASSPLIASVAVASQATGNPFALTVDDVTFDERAIPEPTAALAMAIGLAVLGFGARRRS